MHNSFCINAIATYLRQDVAMKYQVVSMPTFLLMKKGNVVDKVVGADKEQLKAKIEHRLY